MRSFQSRNPIPIALVGLLGILLVVVAAYRSSSLPFIGRGTTYHAVFANAAGLRAGDPTKIAGVVVGHVSSVELVGTTVEVGFDVGGAWVGDSSNASVQLNTLLGQRYLQVDPRGSRPLDAGTPIPLDHTETPAEIVPTLNKLSATVGDIDTSRLAKAFDELSSTFAGTPRLVRQTLHGLSRLSLTVSRRDDTLRQMLGRANAVTNTLAGRDREIGRLITDLGPLLGELHHRRQAIHALLVGAQVMARQLDGLVADNNATLTPALRHLSNVADVLANNQQNLDDSIRVLAPYVHLFTNAVGNGRWFDAYVCGLVPPPAGGVNSKGC